MWAIVSAEWMIGLNWNTAMQRSRNDLMHPSGMPGKSPGPLKTFSLEAMKFSVSRLVSRLTQAPKLVNASTTLAPEARSIALA